MISVSHAKHKISIITVSYNAARTIEQTIASVVAQTYDDIEYIIIDGHSSDTTVEIIKKYEDKIAYWVTEQDSGIYDAMNKGIRAAKGDYIHFLNADDCFVDNEIIARVVSEIKEDVELLSGPIWLVDEQYAMQRLINKKPTNEMILSGVMVPHQGMLIKADFMKRNLFSLSYKAASDYEVLLKCILEGRNIRYVDFPLVYYSNMGLSSRLFDLCEQEYKDILNKYNIRHQYSCAFPNRNSYSVSRVIKSLLKKAIKAIHLYRLFLQFKGWEAHSCSSTFCRWCRRKS